MIAKGKIFKLESGRRIRIENFLSAGGQGEVYTATDLRSSQSSVLKVFFKRFSTPETVKRIRFLINHKFDKICPVFRPPVDMIANKNIVAHYTPYINGESLEEFLTDTQYDIMENFQIAISIAHAIAELHRHKIAHGDIRADNVLIEHSDSVTKSFIIDLDNFMAQGVSAPPMIGHDLYMAPELRKAYEQGRPMIPDIYSDCFALGILMHEILLLKHPAAGYDTDKESFNKAMSEGRWLHDPAVNDSSVSPTDGLSSQILDTDLSRLFRKSVSLDRSQRPSARLWESVLKNTLSKIDFCPKCNSPNIIKTYYPLCGHPYPILKLVTRTGAKIYLNRGTVVVGRDNLNGSDKVSKCHAVFYKIGPKVWIEPRGRNGTFMLSREGWVKLPNGKRKRIRKDNIIGFADTLGIIME